ncbi:MAG: hypothetical protein Q8P35_00435 [Candidatus Yanofskybacteria bacterium]|nr:hypothetical protein [Candidatus Yanofskybacteria bacterium]
MTKRTRRVLFLLAILLFIAASFIAVAYAQGYKYSFEDKEFVHTGAISLKTNTDAKIFFDDELHGSTSFIGSSYGIDRLLPGDYKLRLYREGFSPWEKSVAVQEGMRVDFPRILILATSEEETIKTIADIEQRFNRPNGLVLANAATIAPTPVPTATPQITGSPSPGASPSAVELPRFYIERNILYQTVDGKPEKIAENVSGFTVSDGNRKIAWWNSHIVWVMWLEDNGYQPHHKQGDVELLTRFAAPIERATWFDEQDHIVVDSNGYKIIEIDKRGGLNIIKI